MIKNNYDGLVKLNMHQMAEIYIEQTKNNDIIAMPFDERIAMMIDAEISAKNNLRIYNIKRRAKLKISNASVEDIRYYDDRELDKSKIITLSTCDFIEANRNIVITGATGSGKTYLSCALANKACEKGIAVRYVRLPDLLLELDEARENNTYRKRLKGFAKTKLLVIDEWMLSEVTKFQRNDILELLELRYGTTSTIFASQYSPEGWISKLGKSAITDSILDRVVSNAYLINIKGSQSMRTRE